MSKVIECYFLYYRRSYVYYYMYWQWPRIGTGKTPSFIVPRLNQQFTTVVVWFFLFAFSWIQRWSCVLSICGEYSSHKNCNVKIKHQMAPGSISKRDTNWICSENGVRIGLKGIKQQSSLLADDEHIPTHDLSYFTYVSCSPWCLLKGSWMLFKIILVFIIKKTLYLIF